VAAACADCVQKGWAVLRIYKNAIFQAIRQEGFDSRAFNAQEGNIPGFLPGSTTYIREIPSFHVAHRGAQEQLWFLIRIQPGDAKLFQYRYSRFTPTFLQVPMDDFAPDGRFTDIEEILGNFKGWLGEEVGPAIEDETMPDLWAQLSSQDNLASEILGEGLNTSGRIFAGTGNNLTCQALAPRFFVNITRVTSHHLKGDPSSFNRGLAAGS